MFQLSQRFPHRCRRNSELSRKPFDGQRRTRRDAVVQQKFQERVVHAVAQSAPLHCDPRFAVGSAYGLNTHQFKFYDGPRQRATFPAP